MAEKQLPKYFVWVKTAKGRGSPELWYDDLYRLGTNSFRKGAVKTIDEAMPGDLIFFRVLLEEDFERLKDPFERGLFGDELNIMIATYPCPKGGADEIQGG